MADDQRSTTGPRLWFTAVALIAALNGLFWAFFGLGTAPFVRIPLVLVFVACAGTFAYFAVRTRSASGP